MNKKFIQKISLLFLALSIFVYGSTFAEESDDYPVITNTDTNGFTVGVNFDPYYFAPGVKAGYRINSYIGVHGLVQYASSDDASNIPAEKSDASLDTKKNLSQYSYKNLFSLLVFDAYPLENGFKISAGIGYMDRSFSLKKANQELTNSNKMILVASIGFEGLFLADQGFGYDINIGMKYMDTELKSETIEAKKSNWKAIPDINIALTYSL